MSTAFKLIVVGLVAAIVNLSTASPTVRGFNSALNVGGSNSIQEQAERYNYTYTPGVGAHKIHTQEADWNTARRICEDEGGHLAIINSVNESKVIHQLHRNLRPYIATKNPHIAHIGIHELFNDGDWVTIHGEPLANTGFSNWRPAEPNHLFNNTEHCGSISHGGKLNDMRCTRRTGFVCELPDASNSVPMAENEGPDGQQRSARRKGYTYTPSIGLHKVHTEAKNWNSARKICIGEGGHLAIVNSPAESEAIARLFANSGNPVESADPALAHVGLHDVFHEGQFVTVHGERVENTGFNEWANGEPDNHGSNENCGSLDNSGKLNDVSCARTLSFVCELPYHWPY